MMVSMTQEKLGDAVSLTFQQIQKYEKGTNRIGASRLQQIAGILQVPPSFFFEGAPGVKAVDKNAPPDISTAFFQLPYAADLARDYIAIAHNADRHVVAEVARSIANRKK